MSELELLLLIAVLGPTVATWIVWDQGRERHAVQLTFPRGMDVAQGVAALRSLTGLLPPRWRRLMFGSPSVVFEHLATSQGVEHWLRVPAGKAEFVVAALKAAVPGLRVTRGENGPAIRPSLARELRCTGSGRLRSKVAEATNAGVLAALHPLRPGEAVVVQYVITPVAFGPPSWVAGMVSWLADRDAERQDPEAEPELAAAVRIGVTAREPRGARQLSARVLGAFHAMGTNEARLVRRLLPNWLAAARTIRAARPDWRAAVVRADELAAFVGFPLRAPQLPGLTLGGARELPAISAIPAWGLVLGDSTVASPQRPIAIPYDQVSRSIHLCAPTGAGKSTVLCSLACQLIEAGRGLVLIDSKGDLAADVIDRIPAARQQDVIVFDPADREAVVGFNLIGGAEEAELIVDHVVGQFRARYGATGLGPRSEDILRSSLLTLATRPGYTLCEVEPLLTNAAFRRTLVGQLEEPVLEGFWSWFGALSDAARAEAIAPLANKLRSFTLRRRVRSVIGQSEGLDLARVLAEGKILVVSLARGLVGEDAAALIGAAMTARLWTAIQGRASLSPSERPPVTVICDEFQDFAALPLSFSDAVAQSRGYGVGWVLAHQHLAQLDTSTRQAVLANCRSRVVMQTTASDAAAFARELGPDLTPADLQWLGPFEAYACVSVGAAVAPPASVRTRPAPPTRSSREGVRAASRARYGRSPAEVDAAIRRRVAGRAPAAPVGGIRRDS